MITRFAMQADWKGRKQYDSGDMFCFLHKQLTVKVALLSIYA